MLRALPLIIFFLSQSLLADSSEVVVSENYPVDISFMVVDLKYNDMKGMQICEIQHGIDSGFPWYDLATGEKNDFSRKIIKTFMHYQQNVWHGFCHICDPELYKAMTACGFKRIKIKEGRHSDSDFISYAMLPVRDTHDIASYHGLFIGNLPKTGLTYREFKEAFPAIIPIDSPFSLFRRNKAAVNALLRSDEELQHYKPRCGIYPKINSGSVCKKIKEDTVSEFLVIKPSGSANGEGVIICHRENLETVLDKMLSEMNPDDSYGWWSDDKQTHFLVEEFVPSNTVYVPHLNDLPYDPTMRAIVILVFTEGKIDYHFIECQWKLPTCSLIEEGSLNAKHKSYGYPPYIETVDSRTRAAVEEQLEFVMRRLYRILLTNE